jgi:hypothetical protein
VIVVENTEGVGTDLATMPESTPLDVTALAHVLCRCKKSIQRAVRRGELPAGFKLLGRTHWTVGTILAHLQARQDAALKAAARRDRAIQEVTP